MSGEAWGLGRLRPTFEALAVAVCPDNTAGELIDATLEEVEAGVSALAAPAQKAVVAAAGALEVFPLRPRFGSRRFSALTVDERRHVLEDWAATSSRSWRIVRLLRDLVVLAYYEQPEVRASVGYEPDGWIAERAAVRLDQWADAIDDHRRLLLAPAPLRGTARPSTGAGAFRAGAELPAAGIECDVVVVGSGAGGAVVAAELAEAGLSVAVLEEGGHHRTEEFTTGTTEMLRRLYRDGGASTTLGRVPILYSEGRCVGGSTVVNGAMAFRAPERVLDRWAVEAGIRSFGRGGLDAEYERVERFLSATEQDPDSIGRDQTLLRDGANRLGWRVIDDVRAQVHCAGCNVCTWGCPTGAKQSTLVSYLPRAVSFGATVWSGCRVDRVSMRGKRAVGVEGRVADGDGERPFTVRARRVVVSCGAVQTPALLQRSGVRPPSGALGRNLAVHPGAPLTALFDEPVTGWKGTHQAFQVREFEREGIVFAAVNLPPSLVARSLPLNSDALAGAMADYDRMVTAGVLVEDTGTGRVRAVGRQGALATYRLNDRDAATVARAIFLLSEALIAAGAHTVHLPFDGMPALRGGDDLRRWSAVPIAPERMLLSTVHVMGTARLGADPVHAVCDPWGAVHETDRLFVADASLFPSPIGVNPMLTIMALATRVSGGIIDGWTGR